jgi:hypothetical protein
MDSEHLRFLMSRYDQHFDSVNNKGNFLLTFNTFIFGAIIVSYKDIIQLIHSECLKGWMNLCLLIFVILSLVSLALIIKAIYPFLDSKPTSLLYFGSIASMKKDIFINKFRDQEEAEIQEDFFDQLHQLSTGLIKKYKNLSRACFFIYFQLLMFLPILIILISDKY